MPSIRDRQIRIHIFKFKFIFRLRVAYKFTRWRDRLIKKKVWSLNSKQKCSLLWIRTAEPPSALRPTDKIRAKFMCVDKSAKDHFKWCWLRFFFCQPLIIAHVHRLNANGSNWRFNFINLPVQRLNFEWYTHNSTIAQHRTGHTVNKCCARVPNCALV